MGQPPDASDDAIVLSRARIGYPGVTVLDEVNLDVARGEVVAVLGASGSGKSTLLQTIIGLIEPLAGEVRLLGREMKPVERANELQARLFWKIGVAFQNNALFSDMTVGENLAIVAREQLRIPEPVIAELVRFRLDAVDLHGLETRMPDSLSGGQRKRVALARAIMLEPEVLFYDEPTAGLDPLTSTKIIELIGKLREDLGAALFIVTHDEKLIRSLADRVVIVGEGRIRADGHRQDLLHSQDPIVRQLLPLGSHQQGAP